MDKEGDLPNPVSGDATEPIESGDSGDVKPEGTRESELQNHVDQDMSAKDTSSAETMDVDSLKDKNGLFHLVSNQLDLQVFEFLNCYSYN